MDARIFADVSNFTTRFDAHRVASAGAVVVGVLCTDGLDFYSDKHAEQARHAHEAGMVVWHYHFARPEANPSGTGEAAHFWRRARPQYQAGDRLVLDVERMHALDGEPPYSHLVAYVHRIDRTLHEISGVHEAPYMPDSLFRGCGPSLQPLSGDFWLASWGGKIARLGHGRRMIAQQISNGAEGEQPFSYPGIGACDTNRLQRWTLRQLERERRLRRARKR